MTRPTRERTMFAKSLFTSRPPDGWTLVPVGDVLVSTEYGLSEPGDSEGDTPIVGMRDINSGAINLADLATVNGSAADWSKLRLRVGDILLNRTNSPDLVGKVGIVREDTNVVFASYLVRLNIDPNAVDAEYLNAWLNGSIAQRALKRLSTRGVSQANINPTEFRRHCPLLLPQLSEQRKIVAILRACDEVIEKVRTLRSAKLRRSYGVAQRLLAPTRAIGRDLMLSHWEPCTLGDVFVEKQDRNGLLRAEDVVTVGKYAIRKQSEHFTRSVASADLSNYWIISPGDFVYDPMSAYYGAVGRYAGTSDGLVSPAYRVLHLNEGVSPEFMEHLLRSHHMRFLFEARSSQGNRDGKRRLLQRDEFESIEFMMPPEPEQTRIAETLADFRLDVAETQRLLDRLETQKRGLLQKLLVGEWRVPC
jgi:type I restriction enzyme S subunit